MSFCDWNHMWAKSFVPADPFPLENVIHGKKNFNFLGKIVKKP